MTDCKRARLVGRTRPAAVQLLRGLAIVAAIAAAVSGCGGDKPDALPQLDASRLAAIERLTPQQYARIKTVYVAAVAVDNLAGSPTPLQRLADTVAAPGVAAFKAAEMRALDACDRLGKGDDQLLRALRASCPDVASFSVAISKALMCSDDDECADAFGAASAAATRALASGHFSDRAVRATQLPGACKRALVTPAAVYGQLERLGPALRAMQRSLASGSDDDLAAATSRLGEVTARDFGPSARQMLDRLRRGCR